MVISDTVGFIRKLPHQLVEAFKATLEELEYADLLLHVIDVSNPEWQQQAQVVENLILELGAGELPRIDVFNKCDWLPAGEIMPHGRDICAISARTGEGVDELLEMIAERLDSGSRRVTLHIPYDKGGVLDQLYREAKVESVEYGETIAVTAVCTPKVLGQMAPFLSRSERSRRPAPVRRPSRKAWTAVNSRTRSRSSRSAARSSPSRRENHSS